MTKFVYIPNVTPSTPSVPSTPSTPTIPTTPTTPQFQAQVYTPSGSLNMRTAPTQSAPRIILIPRKAIVDVLSFASDWSYVRYGTYEGYVMTKYLTAASSSSSSSSSVSKPASTIGYAQVMTAQGGLNMRKSASTGSTRIQVIPQYAYVELKEVGTKWSYVTYNGKSGYVQSKYLQII